MISLVEHRVMKKLAQQIINKTISAWKVESNYKNNDRGRVWVLWNPKYGDFKVIHTHEQCIHELVSAYETNK